MVPDGVFVPGDDGAVSCACLPPPTDEDVEQSLVRTVTRVLRMLKGVLGDEEPEVGALAELCAASMASRSATYVMAATPKRLTAFLEGFSLHVLPHGGLSSVPLPLEKARGPPREPRGTSDAPGRPRGVGSAGCTLRVRWAALPRQRRSPERAVDTLARDCGAVRGGSASEGRG